MLRAAFARELRVLALQPVAHLVEELFELGLGFFVVGAQVLGELLVEVHLVALGLELALVLFQVLHELADCLVLDVVRVEGVAHHDAPPHDVLEVLRGGLLLFVFLRRGLQTVPARRAPRVFLLLRSLELRPGSAKRTASRRSLS